MATFKVGDKVRITDVDSIKFGRNYWNNGDITEVTGYVFGHPELKRTTEKGDEHDGDTLIVIPKEFHAIEKVSPKTAAGFEALLGRIIALEARMGELSDEVEFLRQTHPNAEEVGGPTTSFTVDAKAAGKEIAERFSETFAALRKTANERRKEVVEKAKADVEEIVARGSDSFSDEEDEGNETYRYHYYHVEFVVNEDKRTVVAIVRAKTALGRVVDTIKYRGIAKCNPDDVFNADIGKAIAVRRAFDLPVPEDYEFAPQPDEVVPGMVVKNEGPAGGTCDIKGVNGRKLYLYHSDGGPYFTKEFANIISDTEAKY